LKQFWDFASVVRKQLQHCRLWRRASVPEHHAEEFDRETEAIRLHQAADRRHHHQLQPRSRSRTADENLTLQAAEVEHKWFEKVFTKMV
tara:strand:- start:115 stop:381 length:267 start_codon:yes stop_codon:yes gene_type:complete